jgi:transposase
VRRRIGDQYLRRILVVGAHAVLRRAKQNPEKYPWLTQLLGKRCCDPTLFLARVMVEDERSLNRRSACVYA